jgi:hypothetical protein
VRGCRPSILELAAGPHTFTPPFTAGAMLLLLLAP